MILTGLSATDDDVAIVRDRAAICVPRASGLCITTLGAKEGEEQLAFAVCTAALGGSTVTGLVYS